MKSIARLLSIAFLLVLAGAVHAQSAEEIIQKHLQAIGGVENWKKVNTLKQEANLSVQGFDIPIVMTGVHMKGFKQEFSAMGQTGYTIVTPDKGWNFNPIQGAAEPVAFSETELKSAKHQLDIQGPFVDYAQKGNKVEKLTNEDVAGKSCFRIKLTRADGQDMIYYFDPETFYNIRTSMKVTMEGNSMEIMMNLSNHKKLPEGIVIPFTMENSSIPAPVTISKVTVNGPVDEAIFQPLK